MAVNIHHAKTHLSRLIAQAENGEEVIIARNGKPVVTPFDRLLIAQALEEDLAILTADSQIRKYSAKVVW